MGARRGVPAVARSHTSVAFYPFMAALCVLAAAPHSAPDWLIFCVIKREFVQIALLISIQMLLAWLMHSKQFCMLAPCESSTGAETKVAKPGQGLD